MSLLMNVPLDGLSAVFLDDGGEVHKEVIGAKTTSASPPDGCVVIYQRGLIPAQGVSRCHRSLISPYKIKFREATANVPWSNFAWLPSKESMIKRVACMHSNLDDSVVCFDNIGAEDVMVVGINGRLGQHVYGWYVAFPHKHEVLTPIPRRHIIRILKRTTAICKCGRCRHPLYAMVNRRNHSQVWSFDRKAVAYFSEFHKCVLKSKCDNHHVSALPTPPDAPKQFTEDTCSLCLDETLVASTCVQQGCNTKLCSGCISKTRGLCLLCDRSKLNNSVGFLCHSCNNATPLDEYGHRCNRCQETTLCVRCFKNFNMCLDCHYDITAR